MLQGTGCGLDCAQLLQDEGRLKAEALSDNKAKLRQARKQAKALALSINATKQSIDAASAAAPFGTDSPAAGVEEGAAEGGADPAVSANSDTEQVRSFHMTHEVDSPSQEGSRHQAVQPQQQHVHEPCSAAQCCIIISQAQLEELRRLV